MDCHVGILKGGAYGGTRNDNISIWFDRSYILACNLFYLPVSLTLLLQIILNIVLSIQ